MRRLLPISFFLLFYTCLIAQTNEGTQFWFGFMEHRDVNQNSKVAMITAKQATSGTIRMPKQGWSQSFSVGANDVTLVNLPGSSETLGSESITNTGIEIVSNDPVSVYIHQYFSMRSEAAVVLPVETLGREYYTMNYTGVNIQGQDYPSEFLVVATQDETVVNITVADRTVRGRNAGSTFSVTLNRGETYQVQAAVGDGDMTGSYVTADKPFALMSGNSWTQVPSDCPFRDNLLEQMYPVAAFGRQYITVPNANVNFDVFRVLAAEDGTTIRIFRGATVSEVPLNAGRFYEFSSSAPNYIVGDKPILVAQFNVGSNCSGHSLGDPSMVVLNSIEQTRDTVTLFNSRFENITENYINIITRTADTDFVLFDGSPLIGQGGNFFPIEANPDFSFARVRVETGAHTIISEGCGVIATAYGYGNVESYAYSGGASFSPINANPIPEGGCLNDTIFFDTGLSPARYNFQWDLGDGTTTNEAKFSHFYNALGSYPVSLILEDECLGTIDTLYRDLSVTLRQAVSTLPDTALCEDGTAFLGATDLAEARYEWKGPNNYIEEVQFPVLSEVAPNQSGQYEVIGIVSGCATFPAFMEVDVVAKPKPNLGLDTAYCVKDQLAPLELFPGNFTTYSWQDRSSTENFMVEREGTYIVEVTNDFGCVNIDSLVVTQICPTKVYVPNAFSPNRDGINDSFEIYGNDIEAIQLYIYDRWGGLLYETNELSGWNGRANGDWAPGGIYTWVLIVDGIDEEGLPQQQKLSGTVMLLK